MRGTDLALGVCQSPEHGSDRITGLLSAMEKETLYAEPEIANPNLEPRAGLKCPISVCNERL
eukprot:1734093-Rhodomonas_salina.2